MLQDISEAKYLKETLTLHTEQTSKLIENNFYPTSNFTLS